jgi:DNA-binding response OmpR family regulator
VKKKTILLLEDEDELLLTLGSLLRDQRYNVIEAKTAEDALKTLKEITPDLIIADIKLPGIDGFDFFHVVYQDIRYKSIPFIYLTAFNNLKAAIRAKEEGAADYITKPFDLEYLMVRISGLIPP